MQDDITITNNAISGELKYVDSGALATDWGAGYFLALKFDDFAQGADHVYVGLTPSVSSGLVDVLPDPDKNGVFKITNPATQKFTVKTVKGDEHNTEYYSLAGLTFEAVPEV